MYGRDEGGRVVSDINDGLVVFFFFQAEDGIRDRLVTGVQTCALPIYLQIGKFRYSQTCSQGHFDDKSITDSHLVTF